MSHAPSNKLQRPLITDSSIRTETDRLCFRAVWVGVGALSAAWLGIKRAGGVTEAST